ncbi:hypothetical protein [Paenibacillus shenyangensis]|uniref:hypothetical protein n=1 Tax=Paenibacillus sp. A9 TaxID=1284352 RepID=UPI00036B56DE|nr:hypothetical protein [Paenibacillus sp. A9]
MKRSSRHESVTEYLIKNYNVKKGRFKLSMGAISRSQDITLKQKLIQEESFENLGSIHSGIEAQYESMKQISLIVSSAIFFLSTILGVLAFYLQQSMKQIDWTHEIIMLKVKAKIELLKNIPWFEHSGFFYKAQMGIYDNILKEQNKAYSDVIGGIYTMYLVSILPIFIFFVLFIAFIWSKYSWLSSIHFCVKEAYKLKEKSEKQKD